MNEVFADLEQLSRGAAEWIVVRARMAVAQRGRFCLALAGGRTPRRTYELLAQQPFNEQMPWSQVHLFWGDERCVPSSDSHSNQRMVRETLLERVPLPAEQVYPMACVGDPTAAAEAYQKILEEFFAPDETRFDLVLLGLGEDGHTASLIPGTAAVQETRRLVTTAQVAGEAFARITLTTRAINMSREVIFLVAGRNKADILYQVLQGPSGRFPAQRIVPAQGEIRWLFDRDAAGQSLPG